MDATVTGVGIALIGVLLLGWVIYRQSVGGVVARAASSTMACPVCREAFAPGKAVVRCAVGHLQHRNCVPQGAPCAEAGCGAVVP